MRGLKAAAPSKAADALANRISVSITSDVVLAASLAAPYCKATLLVTKAKHSPKNTGQAAESMAGMGKTPNAAPNIATTVASRAPPPNMASMRAPLGAWLCFFNRALVMAKLRPPISASQSAPLCGTGHGESGVFSTNNTPAMAKPKRSNDARVGLSPSKPQATRTDQAGIR